MHISSCRVQIIKLKIIIKLIHYSLFCFRLWFVSEEVPNFRYQVNKDYSSSKHQDSPQPVVQGERVLEVVDGKQQTDEFSQCNNKSDNERRTLCCKDEHPSDTNILKNVLRYISLIATCHDQVKDIVSLSFPAYTATSWGWKVPTQESDLHNIIDNTCG